MNKSDPYICLAEIVGVHGVRGQVKIKVFADDPQSLIHYAPLSTEDGKKTFKFLDVTAHGNHFLGHIEGLTDRTAAEKLRGTKLCVTRSRLPEIKNEGTYYHADLLGLRTVYPDGADMGKVVSVVNFGAGDLIEIKPQKGASFYLPFTQDVVKKVDIAAGIVTVNPPDGLLD